MHFTVKVTYSFFFFPQLWTNCHVAKIDRKIRMIAFCFQNRNKMETKYLSQIKLKHCTYKHSIVQDNEYEIK